MSSTNACRVCGFDHGFPTWADGDRTPTHDICACCGSEFGYEDCTPEAARRARGKWIADGAKWFREREMPPGWSLSEQLKDVPDGFA